MEWVEWVIVFNNRVKSEKNYIWKFNFEKVCRGRGISFD